MLLTQHQYSRLCRAFPRKSHIKVGPIPDADRRRTHPFWNEYMDVMANEYQSVDCIVVEEEVFLANGRVMLDVVMRLEHATEGYVADFNLEWLDDPTLKEILDNPNPSIPVTKVQAEPPQTTSAMGILGTAMAAMATVVGVSAIKHRQKSKEAARDQVSDKQISIVENLVEIEEKIHA